MKKNFTKIVLSSLFVLAIAPPVESYRVNSRKVCERYSRKYLYINCA